MPPITLQAIDAKQTELDAKQTELSKLIAQFKDQATRPVVYSLQKAEFTLQPGEHYAGPVLDEAGNVLHHLVLMAQKPTAKLNWSAAMAWADGVGGTLPNRQEMSLLFANCKPHLQPVWHWSCEVHENDASYAWGCGFGNGGIDIIRKSYEGRCVAVRRFL